MVEFLEQSGIQNSTQRYLYLPRRLGVGGYPLLSLVVGRQALFSSFLYLASVLLLMMVYLEVKVGSREARSGICTAPRLGQGMCLVGSHLFGKSDHMTWLCLDGRVTGSARYLYPPPARGHEVKVSCPTVRVKLAVHMTG